MSLGSILTGSSGGYPDWYKNQIQQNLSGWNALSYDPRQDVAQTMESYDNQLANQQASGMAGMGALGFGGASQFGGTRARFAAMTQSQMRRAYNDWLMRKLSGQAGAMAQLGPMLYKPPTQGLAGQIGGLAAAYYGAKAGAPSTSTNGGGGGAMTGTTYNTPIATGPDEIIQD